jgi:S-disulfanyl-L-cysteine oxidoreductase SoxD
MSRWVSAIVALTVAVVAAAASAQTFPGIGRPATPVEVRAWDIDVRPDFEGLPPGSGSVARGQQIWDARCASCHGTFGESNQMFAPLVGGTKPEDVKAGRATNLGNANEQRTMLMKLASLSALWDYIRRAMPWEDPKSLADDDVYAVTAYILHLGDLVPGDFVLSDRNVAEVQRRLPNRAGLTRKHGLWEVRGKPDVTGSTCMTACGPEPTVVSSIPEHGRALHGNLADQQRMIGPARGVVTAPSTETQAAGGPQLIARLACAGCHRLDSRLVGPSFREIADRYAGQGAAPERLASVVRDGGVGAWGTVAMPPQPHVGPDDARQIVEWILAGARGGSTP